jgi:hypothetical protein
MAWYQIFMGRQSEKDSSPTASEHTHDFFELPYCGPDAVGSITLLCTGLAYNLELIDE